MRTATVRVGYKNTELGVIPKDWDVCRFSDHFNIYAGGDVPKHSFSEIQSNSFPNPIFANALKDKGLYGYTKETRSRAGSLTITARGYLGHAEYRNTPFYPIVRLLVLEPTGNLDAAFTTYAINDRVVFAIESTGVPQLTAPQVGKYAVAAPPTLSEQRAIAAALGDADALISGLDQLIAKKRDLKQAAMQQLLTGQRRLPGFSGEWQLKRLGDLAQATMGQSPNSKNYNKNRQGLPLIQGNADIEGRKTIRRVWTTQITKICDANDLILTVRAPVGEIAIASERSCIGRGVCSLKPIGVDSDYLFHALVFSEKSWRILEQGSTFTSANSTQIASFLLPVAPTREEQSSIATVLSDMDAELAALEARRDKAVALKQGMMQELLTGRIRLV